MITPELARINLALFARFPSAISWGVYNRRYIAGTKTWSQHAWGNAVDISNRAGTNRYNLLDTIHGWALDQRVQGWLPIGTILWRVPAHFDHIHLEAKPKRTGNPPYPSSVSPVLDVIAELGAQGAYVRLAQIALNEARRRNTGAWPELTVDGRYGPLMQLAVSAYQTAAGIAGTAGVTAGKLDSRTAWALAEYTRPDA